ncbi:MAG: PD40 domain-containing protein [Fimbriimonadaceae bacterium]|nr:PD40 domain-containing protein [Fimbriimonadaceae bacterium]
MLVPLALVLASEAPAAILREPDVFGDKVAFRCEGDLWIGDRTTGNATRLTRHEGLERFPRFSPDGKWLAFTAEYDGPREAYVMPVEGGPPRRLTFTGDYAQVLDWTPDGKGVLVQTRSFPRSFALKMIPLDGGPPTRLPLEFASHGSLAPDGNRLAFTRFNRYEDAWFRYQGGLKNDVWVGDLSRKSFRKVVSTRFTNEFPVWVGDRVAYVAASDRGFSVATVGAAGGSPRRLAGPFDLEVRHLQTDGTRLVFELGFGVAIVDARTGARSDLRFDLGSDRIHARPFSVTVGSGVTAPTIGGTGARLFGEARGRIVSFPVKQGEARVLLGKDGVRYRYPALSPNGKSLAYFGDESGEPRLYVADAEGTNPTPITPALPRQLRRVAWSPDSKWLSYSDSTYTLRIVRPDGTDERTVHQGGGSRPWEGMAYDWSPDAKWLVFEKLNPKTYFTSLALYYVETKATTDLLGPAADRAPVFSRDGKWLAFASMREAAPRWDAWMNQLFTEKPWKVCLLSLRKAEASPFAAKDDEEEPAKKPDETKPTFTIELDGLADRIIEVPLPAGDANHVEVVGDRVLVQDGPTIRFFDLKAKQGGVLTTGPEFEVSADGKKVLIRGNPPRVVDPTSADLPPTAGAVAFPNLRFTVDPIAEWRQIYWDAWRHLRDYFYVPNMHGLNWRAVGDKYAQYLPAVRERSELTELIRWLQAELGTSHMYRDDGDTRRNVPPMPMGYLGWDLAPDPSGFPKIARLFRGDGFNLTDRSPLLEAGLEVREGQFVIEVGGVFAKSPEFPAALIGKVGATVSVTVNDKPTAEGARKIYVKPVANENTMRYREWVRGNRDAVAKASAGRVGYLHVRAMVEPDMADFVRQYFPQRDKEALIVDVRFNNGGNVSNNIAAILKQRPVAFFNQRNLPDWTRQGEFFPGPMACLINEFCISNGEEFPHQFRALGLGPLIGRRTTGGEVGSDPGWPLIDGGSISVPNYGAWTPKNGWIIEGPGVSPDLDVESDPNLWARGEDAQLKKAVDVLLSKLAKKPTLWPKTPPPPVRTGKG